MNVGVIAWPRTERRKRQRSNASERRGKPSLKSGPRETWIFFRLQTKYLNGREHTCRQRPLDAQVPFETHSVVESANAERLRSIAWRRRSLVRLSTHQNDDKLPHQKT